LVLLAPDQVFCSVGCDFDAAGLDSVHAVLCFPVAGALLRRPLHPGVSAAPLVVAQLPPGFSAVPLAVAQLPHGEHVALPSLSVPRPTRMSWDPKQILVGLPRFLLGVMIAMRRNFLFAELQVPLRRRQGVHQLNGMRRKRIRFEPRKSVFFVSERWNVTKRFHLIPSAVSETSL